MDEIDQNCWILEPEHPTRADASRRIALGEHELEVSTVSSTSLMMQLRTMVYNSIPCHASRYHGIPYYSIVYLSIQLHTILIHSIPHHTISYHIMLPYHVYQTILYTIRYTIHVPYPIPYCISYRI